MLMIGLRGVPLMSSHSAPEASHGRGVFPGEMGCWVVVVCFQGRNLPCRSAFAIEVCVAPRCSLRAAC